MGNGAQLGLAVGRPGWTRVGRGDNLRGSLFDPFTRMWATFVVAAEGGTAGTLEVVPPWDGHRDVGGEYGQQHQRGVIDDGRGRGEGEGQEIRKYVYGNVIVDPAKYRWTRTEWQSSPAFPLLLPTSAASFTRLSITPF